MIIFYPKGPKFIPFFMIFAGIVCFFCLLYDMDSLKSKYNPENAFYSASDDYDKADDAQLFAIEDLTPIQVHSTGNHMQNTYCLSTFKDGTGSVHYVLLDVTKDDPFYKDFKESLNEEDYSINGFSISGVFYLTSPSNQGLSYYGNVLEHNPLSDEVHTRVLKFMPNSEDYEAFIASTYKSKVTMQRIFAVLSLAAVVAGIFIWRKLSAKGY